MLRIAGGTPIKSPLTGSSVLGYRMVLGFLETWRDVAGMSSFGRPRYVDKTEFHDKEELIVGSDVLLESRDGKRVLLPANSYRLEDDLDTVEVHALPHDSEYRERLGKPPGKRWEPCFRFFSLSESQIVLVDGDLVPTERNAAVYRGASGHDCDFTVRAHNGELIRVVDQVLETAL